MRQSAAPILSLCLLFLLLRCHRGVAWVGTGRDLPLAESKALRAFRDSMVEHDGLLDSWVNDTHPCSWRGVVCDCGAVQPRPADCPDAQQRAAAEHEHVFALDFGPYKASNARLHGVLSPHLAGLTEARVLHLHSNSLYGTIVTELGNLPKLSRLSLRDNRLTGTLPPSIVTSHLLELYVDQNSLEGEIPQEWCSMANSTSGTINPGNNEQICGELPDCFHGTGAIQPAHLSGTCVLRSAGAPDQPETGGVCDKTPPLCLGTGSCISAPSIVNNLSYFEFNFTDFDDPESGIREYRWMLGTALGLSDAAGPRPCGDAINPDGSHRQVFDEPVVSLTNGGTYYITLSALNGACPALSANVSSSAILVDNTPPVAPQSAGRDVIFANSACSFQEVTQANTSVLNACWQQFLDPESKIWKYEIAVMASNIVYDDDDSADGDDSDTDDTDGGPSGPGSPDPGPGGPDDDGKTSPMVKVDAGVLVLPFSGEDIECDSEFCYASRVLDLEPGIEYHIVVKAYNTAGDSTVRQSTQMTIVLPEEPKEPMSPEITAALIAGLLLVLSLAGSLSVILCVFLLRRRARRTMRKQLRREQEQIRQALVEIVEGFSSSSSPDSGGGGSVSAVVAELPEVFFVFTDVEESTTMAAADPDTYSQVQAVHDRIMRREISSFNGYEINTQGDAFEVAFPTASNAVRFCLKVQQELLMRSWPKKVLDLPTCGVVQDQAGSTVFAGPRVRMGIHLARQGQFRRRLNTVTNHIQFEGPAYQMAEVIGDSGHGGQIVMDAPTYERCSKAHTMGIFNHIGGFQLGISSSAPTSMYEVLPPITSPLPPRRFPDGLRNKTKVADAMNLSTVGVMPEPADPEGHGIVVITLPPDLSDANYEKVSDALASCGQMFNAARARAGSSSLLYVLPCAADAVQFTQVGQMTLMAACCPSRRRRPPLESPDGVSPQEYARNDETTVIWRGVRLGMVVHCGRVQVTALATLGAKRAGDNGDRQGTHRVETAARSYSIRGECIPYAKAVAETVHPGQVVLTSSAWRQVQALSMRGIQFMSLGLHKVSGISEDSTLLMEVLPASLASREFPPLASLHRVEPGFRDAPCATQKMAIVFCKVPACPEAGPPGWSQERVQDVYADGLARWCSMAHRAVLDFDGYECKEIQGKFMMAFADLRNAIAFATCVQAMLNEADWGADLLSLQEFSPRLDDNGKQTFAGGLTPAIGISWGRPTAKNPSRSTGRADYFGSVCNTAARCMASAAYGQVLVDGNDLHSVLGRDYPCIDRLGKASVRSLMPAPSRMKISGPSARTAQAWTAGGQAHVPLTAQDDDGAHDYGISLKDLARRYEAAQFERELHGCGHLTSPGPVRMKGLGLYLLKGIKEPIMLVQAWVPALDARSTTFPATKGSVAEHYSRLLEVSHEEAVSKSSDGTELFVNLPDVGVGDGSLADAEIAAVAYSSLPGEVN